MKSELNLIVKIRPNKDFVIITFSEKILDWHNRLVHWDWIDDTMFIPLNLLHYYKVKETDTNVMISIDKTDDYTLRYPQHPTWTIELRRTIIQKIKKQMEENIDYNIIYK
jgi:hypothetical protein